MLSWYLLIRLSDSDPWNVVLMVMTSGDFSWNVFGDQAAKSTILPLWHDIVMTCNASEMQWNANVVKWEL